MPACSKTVWDDGEFDPLAACWSYFRIFLRGKKEKSILEHRGSQTLEYWFIGYSQSYLQVHCSLFSHTFKILQIISKLYCKLDKSVSKICHYWHIVMFKNILQVINSPHRYRNSHPSLQCNWLISSIILFFNYY